jgi:hypothetical protein
MTPAKSKKIMTAGLTRVDKGIAINRPKAKAPQNLCLKKPDKGRKKPEGDKVKAGALAKEEESLTQR